MSKLDVGVVVGRFQCDHVSSGHRALIDHVNELHPIVLIVIGQTRTPANATDPLDYQQRATMLREVYPDDTTYWITSLYDYRSNEEWSRRLDELIENYVGESEPILYSGRDGFIPWYVGKYKTELLNLGVECSATERRDHIARYPDLHSQEFRRGVIHAHNTRIFQTYEAVDIALLKPGAMGGYDVAVGKKKGEDQWRFPGGHVEPGEKIVQCAGRELYEETGLISETPFQVIDDFIVDDWRVRRKMGVGYRSWLCVGFYAWGTPKAADDLAELRWFPVQLSGVSQLVEEHQEMFCRLVQWIDNYLLTHNNVKSSS